MNIIAKKKKKIANKYIDYLEKGIVDSPLYGIKEAYEFYHELNSDTTNSELHLLGIFEEKDSNIIALYFTYKWTMKNNEKVEFDVVDIIEFDMHNKINKLKIIYDTVKSRGLVNRLKRNQFKHL